jgi:DNA repair photolyase
MAKQKNMYELSAKQFNPFAGCKHNCSYCGSSFQAQLKRYAKKNCQECYEFKPHTHPERLSQSLPKTKYMQFIFTCANGDIAFCPTPYLREIVSTIKGKPDRTFLIQSKNPGTFGRVDFPDNVILGTTIETNRDRLCKAVADAPPPSKRYRDFAKIEHPLKMVTIEPVMDFDLDVMVKWMRNLSPCMIWLGYDSKNNHLPEPELHKVRELHWELSRVGFIVILKHITAARSSV